MEAVRKITKTVFIEDVEEGFISDIFTLIHDGKWVIAGKSQKDGDLPRKFEIVYAEVGTA